MFEIKSSPMKLSQNSALASKNKSDDVGAYACSLQKSVCGKSPSHWIFSSQFQTFLRCGVTQSLFAVAILLFISIWYIHFELKMLLIFIHSVSRTYIAEERSLLMPHLSIMLHLLTSLTLWIKNAILLQSVLKKVPSISLIHF